MAKKFLTHLNLSQNELQNAVLQRLASAPSSPVEGLMYYNTTSDTPFIYANGTWLDMGMQGSGNGATNLSQTVTATTVAINSDTGTDTTIAAADNTNAGVMTSVMQVKLAGIATGATANSTDATLLARANHTGTQSADTLTDGTTNKAFTATERTKLAGIETAADVTDATNVDAAGAVMNSDTSTAGMSFVIDEDNFASNSATKVPTQQSTKAYVDTTVAAVVDTSPATLDTLNELAAALGDDPNFATTITTSIGTKLAKASNLSDVANAATAFTNIKQAATTTATGVVELATQAEAEAKTDTVRAVTPASLTSFARKATGTIGNGSLTSLPVTHGLGTQYVTAQLFDATSGEMVECDITITSATVVTFTFTVAPTTNQYRYVIVG